MTTANLVWQFLAELAGFWGLSILFALAAYGALSLYLAFTRAPFWGDSAPPRNTNHGRVDW